MKWQPWRPVIAAIQECIDSNWQWAYNSRCKYVQVRFDMRNGHCILTDREGKEISIEQLKYQISEGPKSGIKLWLDDIRPAPDGYVWCKTVKEAKRVMLSQNVLHASLDHDLGACETGYDFVCWMEEHQIWPTESCTVHSANPVGRERMKKVISIHYNRGN